MDETPYLETLYSLQNESEFSDASSPLPIEDFQIRNGDTVKLVEVVEAVETVSANTVSFSPHFSESTTVVAEYDSFPAQKPLAKIPYGSLLGRTAKEDAQDGVAFPLMQESEVRLMRYYIDYMCHWVSSLLLIPNLHLLDSSGEFYAPPSMH
jgi:hypothetical protein